MRCGAVRCGAERRVAQHRRDKEARERDVQRTWTTLDRVRHRGCVVSLSALCVCVHAIRGGALSLPVTSRASSSYLRFLRLASGRPSSNFCVQTKPASPL